MRISIYLVLLLTTLNATAQQFPILRDREDREDFYYDEDALLGFYDTQHRKWKIKPKYKHAGEFGKTGLAFVCRDKFNCGCIDTNGRIRISSIYYYDSDNDYNAESFNDSGNLLVAKAVRHEGEWAGIYGMIDSKGKTLLPFRYRKKAMRNQSRQQEYILEDTATGLCGIVDLSGKILIPFIYDDIMHFDSNVFKFIKKDADEELSGLGDRSGNFILPVEYQFIAYVQNMNMIFVRKENRSGLLELNTLKALIPLEYDFVKMYFGTRLFFVGKNGKCGFVDRDGKVVVPLIYDAEYKEQLDHHNGMFFFMKDGKRGAIDMQGRVAIPFEYDEIIKNRAGSIFAAKKNGKYGYIASDGRELTSFIYDTLHTFYDRFGTAIKNGLFGIIDSSGNEVVPFSYRSLSRNFGNESFCGIISSSRLIYGIDGKLGIMDFSGRRITEALYESIPDFHHDQTGKEYYLVQKDGRYGFIDDSGAVAIPIEFESADNSRCKFIFYPGEFLLTKQGKSYTIDWEKLVASEWNGRQ